MPFGKRIATSSAAPGTSRSYEVKSSAREGWGLPNRSGSSTPLFVGLLTLLLALGWTGWFMDAWRLHVLFERGRPAEAVVLAKSFVHHKFDLNDYKLTYGYTVDGKMLKATGECTRGEYDSIETGGIIPILYDPHAPSSSDPDIHHTLQAPPDTGLQQVKFLCSLAGAALFGAVTFGAGRRLFSRSRN